jgi:hypothetical protein
MKAWYTVHQIENAWIILFNNVQFVATFDNVADAIGWAALFNNDSQSLCEDSST